MEKENKVLLKMSETAEKFIHFYGQYFKKEKDDTDLLSMTTQPFWQSMRLSRKRLDSMGLTEMLDISGEQNKLVVERDGSNTVGLYSREVTANRQFLKDGKRIHKSKNAEICCMSLLQTDVDGEMASCPNCGHVAKLESYIDGCDACGAKFTVQDFETKVSAFSLEENVFKKLKTMISRILIALAIVNVLLIIVGAVGFALTMVRLMAGVNNYGTVAAFGGFLLSVDFVPVGIGGMISLPIVYVLLHTFLLIRYKQRYSNEKIVKDVFSEFSAEDFCQNLEYKLRNIHMTDSPEQVSVFARCPLDDIVRNYQNVVDCNLHSCRFLAVREEKNGYAVDVEVVVKLTLFTGKRIREEYEKLHLSLYGKKEVIKRKSVALREYKCQNCASSLNILEGSTCKACDSVFDYADYGWVFEKYSIAKQSGNIYRKVSAFLIIGYLLYYGLQCFFIGSNDDSSISLFQSVAEVQELTNEAYDAIPLPDEFWQDALLLEEFSDTSGRRKLYELSDTEGFLEAYKGYILDADYVFSKENSTADKYVFYRMVTYEGDTGYFMCIVQLKGTRLELIQTLVETLDEVPADATGRTIEEFAENDSLNTYISITDTRIDHPYFTMTVPEDFIGNVSYAVVVDEYAEKEAEKNVAGTEVAGASKLSQDFSVIFVVDELAFGEGDVSGEGIGGTKKVISREITYGASRNGTLGGISWWTIEDLNWLPDGKIGEACSSFAECYREYYPEHAIGFEGELLQTDAAGTGGYCETNPTDVQWAVGDDLETYYELYSHYAQELDEARQSFDSKMIE